MHEFNYILLLIAVAGMLASAVNYCFARLAVRRNRAFRRVWPYMMSFKVSEVRQISVALFIMAAALACFALFVPLGEVKR